MKRYFFTPLFALLLVLSVFVDSTSAQQAPLANKQLTQMDWREVPAQAHTNLRERLISDPDSYWVVVNKRRPLNPITYRPTDLTVPDMPLDVPSTDPRTHVRERVAQALENMNQAAQAEMGKQLKLVSGFRSYERQREIYDEYVRQYGQEVTDTFSARPGYSEHQTGLAADLSGVDTPAACVLEACFADTPEARWLAANAYRFGFIVRYPEGKTSITGYTYEPWHMRYVGRPLAFWMHITGIQTLEEVFWLPPAPDYG